MKTTSKNKQSKCNKNNNKDVLTVDRVKCSKKDTIVVHKNAPKCAIKKSKKQFEQGFALFKKDGLSPEERLLNMIFKERKIKGVPKELRTREMYAHAYEPLVSSFDEMNKITRKFNHGRNVVIVSHTEQKRIDTLRKKGLSVKAIARELHRSDHTVREYLNGTLNMSTNDMEKWLKSGKRPAHLERVTKPKKR